MQPLTEDLLQSPRLRLLYDELGEALRREEQARQRFRAGLSEDVRAEFINGEVVMQMPARYRHTLCVKHIASLMDAYVSQKKLGVVCTEQSLTSFTRNDYAPDVCYWVKARSKRFTPDQLIFPIPDFIAEVLSPSTAAVDRGVKLEDYAAHGVCEYWLVDPARRTIEQRVLRDGEYHLLGKWRRGSIRSEAIADFEMPVRAAFDEAEQLAALKRVLQA